MEDAPGPGAHWQLLHRLSKGLNRSRWQSATRILMATVYQRVPDLVLIPTVIFLCASWEECYEKM